MLVHLSMDSVLDPTLAGEQGARESDCARLPAASGGVCAEEFTEAIEIPGIINASGLENDVKAWRAVAYSFSGDATAAEAEMKNMPPQLAAIVQELVSLGRP